MIIEDIEDAVRKGSLIKKVHWLSPMHTRYNKSSEVFEVVDSITNNDGTLGLGVIFKSASIKDIPYVGKWVFCDDRGKEI